MEFSAELGGLMALAFLAGFLDAVVGGGGLIQIPALFILLPQFPAATLLGTNKLASVWGTTAAAFLYAKRLPMEWRATLPAAGAALATGAAGAAIVSQMPTELMRPLIMVMLVAVLFYTLKRKDLGSVHAPKLTPRMQLAASFAVGAVIGFYDGFFGPGTGSFLIFAYVSLFGFSFLAASAAAKMVNAVANLAALGYFISAGHVLPAVALPMAVCNLSGSLLGVQVAIRKGSRFVRLLFVVVVLLLLLRFSWDVLHQAVGL